MQELKDTPSNLWLQLLAAQVVLHHQATGCAGAEWSNVANNMFPQVPISKDKPTIHKEACPVNLQHVKPTFEVT